MAASSEHNTEIPQSIWRKLFSCQKGAIVKLASYFQTQPNDKSALVQMPMGTGKTGVMALCCTQFPRYKRSLIVAPAEYLTRQLEEAVTKKFWSDAKLRTPSDIHAKRFTPAGLAPADLSSNSVLICTIQSLQQMHADGADQKYTDLKNAIDLVLFDEGHSEPALTWAKAVRDLEKKVVLFTATPYRNDYRKFRVDEAFTYQFHYDEAERQNIIRHVETSSYPQNTTLRRFADLVLDLSDTVTNVHKDARTLVRCQSANDIAQLVTTLNRARPGIAMGFHTALAETDFLKRRVPILDDVDGSVRVFVHEKLLLQGIDDKRFTALAVFGSMNNARELIQQIGRVIRNDSRQPESAAVLLPVGRPFERWWDNYVLAEKEPEAWQYVNPEFRSSFDPHETSFHEDISFNYSARLFQVDNRLDLPKLLDDIVDELQEHQLDELSRIIDRPRHSAAIIYQLHVQVPFVRERVYDETSLGYLLLHQDDDILFFLNSHGLSPELLDNRFVRFRPNALQRLFSSQDSRITFVDLANSDVSQRAIRGRTARAFSIDEASNSLNDHAHFCRAVRGFPGFAGTLGRRYVGFTRSRVSDSASGSWADFHGWADQVAQVVRSKARAARLFQRYAEIAPTPKRPIPTSILFDIDDIKDSLEDVAGKIVRELEDLCIEVGNGEFSVTIDGRVIPVRLLYTEAKRKFRLESDQLHSDYRVRQEVGGGGRPKSLLSYLNQEQPFRITIANSSLLYAAGSFFRPRWKVSEITSEDDVPMRTCFLPTPSLAHATSEKGTASIDGNRRWQPTSLFGLIDRSTETGIDGFDDLPWLVCDDQQNEVADFIGLNRGLHKLAFIHAKSGDGDLSASSFHDICGQVKKNLDYAHRYSDRTPPNLSLWNGDWRPAGKIFTKGDYVKNRIRRPANIEGREFWDAARELLADPNAFIEVWMVVGGGFRFATYYHEMQKRDPSPQVIQIAYQLQSTLDAVSQMGARLRIFCRP